LRHSHSILCSHGVVNCSTFVFLFWSDCSAWNISRFSKYSYLAPLEMTKTFNVLIWISLCH
jgi:hypothetical protein